MCTLTIISTPTGFRVVMNRDEERLRAPACPPRWHDLPDGRRTLWPIDPLGGGTWIGATDQGLVLAILNVNPEPRPTLPPLDRRLSRGSIIPTLLSAGELGARASIAELARLDLAAFPPFRVVAIERPSLRARPTVIDACWNGHALATHARRAVSACFVSSGLGDACVAIRAPLFAQLVAAKPTPESQDAFHRHRWPERPELSVLMSRAGARTVSITTIDVHERTPTVEYESIPETDGIRHERPMDTTRTQRARATTRSTRHN